MVGVAGKYKGCETCRRRRVKVSESHLLNQSILQPTLKNFPQPDDLLMFGY